MIKYTMCPVIDLEDLNKALSEKGISLGVELRNVLFFENYSNDSCKFFYFDEIEKYEGLNHQDEEEIEKINQLKRLLQESLPGFTKCLIDISW